MPDAVGGGAWIIAPVPAIGGTPGPNSALEWIGRYEHPKTGTGPRPTHRRRLIRTAQGGFTDDPLGGHCDGGVCLCKSARAPTVPTLGAGRAKRTSRRWGRPFASRLRLAAPYRCIAQVHLDPIFSSAARSSARGPCCEQPRSRRDPIRRTGSDPGFQRR
jgi:hypothetical protein